MTQPGYQTALPPSRRRLRLFWVVGLLLLVGSVAGAGFVLHAQGGDSSPAAGNDGAGSVDAERSAIVIGYCDVKGGVLKLSPSQPGRVAKVLVEEGDVEIPAGTVLIEMEDRFETLRVSEARAAVDAAQQQLDQAKEFNRAKDSFKRGQQEAAIEGARHTLEAARQQRDRAQALAKANQLSPEEARAADEKVLALEAALKAEQKKLDELNATMAFTVKQAEQNVKAKQAKLDQAEYALKECKVTAPVNGKVLRVLATVGDLFGAHSQLPALFFVPNQTRIVRAEVEQEFAGKVAVGQRAEIQDDATGQGDWRGKVIHVGEWFTYRRTALPEPVQIHDVRTLECIIELDPNQPPLRINQRVRATLKR